MATNPSVPSTRDSIRTKIFADAKSRFQRKVVDFQGVDIEVRQPSLGQIMGAQENESNTEGTIKLAIEHCYVPGTEEKIFDDADKDSLLALPFDQGMANINQAIADMTGISLTEDDAEKNSEGTQGDITST